MIDSYFIRKYGGPSVLQRGALPQQPLGPGDVRILVHAASVNPLDLRIRDGALKVLLPYRFPLVLGNDCSGVVTEVGRNVKRFRVGDAVYGSFARAPHRHVRARSGDCHRIGRIRDGPDPGCRFKLRDRPPRPARSGLALEHEQRGGC